MEYLYHGSTTQNLKTLEPRKRYTPAGKIDYSAIYATPLIAYAVAHGFPWSSDEGIGLDVVDGKVDISIPKNLRDRLLVPISIYKISAQDFEITKEEVSGYTWHTTKITPVLEEIKFQNVEIALKEMGAKLEFL